MWQFENCLGAVDGKHVAIKQPPGSGSYFYNYKGFFSVVLLAIVNANYEFIYVSCGTNGRISDGGVIKNTDFYELLMSDSLKLPQPVTMPGIQNKLPYVFIGDKAFSLTTNFMTPYKLVQSAMKRSVSIIGFPVPDEWLRMLLGSWQIDSEFC
jgi:hypothetical protein